MNSAREHGVSDTDMLHAYRNPIRVHAARVTIPEVTLMPRSIQEILDHADELARRFEAYEPSASDERPVEEYLLQRAVLARAHSERQIVDAVISAPNAGISWARIRTIVRTEPEAASTVGKWIAEANDGRPGAGAVELPTRTAGRSTSWLG